MVYGFQILIIAKDVVSSVLSCYVCILICWNFLYDIHDQVQRTPVFMHAQMVVCVFVQWVVLFSFCV